MKENPSLHIICGKCGCRSMLEFGIRYTEGNEPGTIRTACRVYCNNCRTLTDLDEIIKQIKD